MANIRIVHDPEECAALWNRHYPHDGIFDFWEVRRCFNDAFGHRTAFIVYEENGNVHGLLPMSRIAEEGVYAFFPGETWDGKTWMEQNRIIARDAGVLKTMIEAIPGRANLRYLRDKGTADSLAGFRCAEVCPDETGYVFLPPQYGYSYETYLSTIPGKSRKKIFAEVQRIRDRGVEVLVDRFDDVGMAFKLNLDCYGERSYFADTRFMASFDRLIEFLYRNAMLRVVAVRVGGAVAAVDIGAVHRGCCAFLAGGTNRAFPGIAKLINLYHMEWACRERMDELDFLSGDFGWKERFRLTRHPLHQINVRPLIRNRFMDQAERIPAYA